MPGDLLSLIITGVVAVVVISLVVFVVRKLVGIALLVALAIGLWMVWNDPGFLNGAADAVSGLF